MGGETKLEGPDLAVGVEESELSDGGLLVGHAAGQSVLLTRRGDTVFAVGANCTHYGAPLADGLVVGESVRCPWHHACFNLRTGEAERAPALDALPCYRVERRGSKLVVLGKKELDGADARPGGNVPAHPARHARAPKSVVIVGAGAAGNAAAEMLRREGYEGPVTLLGAEPDGPVDRPNLSKDYLAGTAPEEWIPLRPDDFYRQHAIELRTGARVERIDGASKRVFIEGGGELGYGALLLCTGAAPLRLDVPGADLPHVCTLRSLADSRALIERAGRAKRAVVVGASFIGLEAAASLVARGLEVHVVAPEARPLERVMGPALGDAIRRLHEDKGVCFHMGETVTRIEASSVTLSGGDALDAGLVVVGIGVRPRVELAAGAGAELDRGVSVDEHLETSVPGIYAAGDIARYPDPRSGEHVRIEHWVVAERQGQLAARNMLGGEVPFDAVPFFWSQHYDTPIAYVGHAASWERIDVAGDIAALDSALAFRSDGRTLAVACIGRDRTSLQAESALERSDEAALRELVPPS
jgi:3-phenylpropionate/trans-cinnamate dioxygenase ferredoxin reductase subunit